MFDRLFARLLPARRPTRPCRFRPGLEQLEDRRLLSATPALAAVQTQALANPTIDSTGATLQYISAGNYQTVASATVSITAAQSGLVQLNFQAQAWSGLVNRIGVRYLIDGQFDSNDAVIRSGTAADAIEDIGSNSWQTLYLTRLINLSTGTHTVMVQVYCTSQDLFPADGLALYAPVLGLSGVNTVDGTNAADGIQVQTLASNANTQTVTTNGTWQTVSTASVTASASKTGLYNLAFQAIANTTLNTRVALRYLIDGNPDPHDAALGANGNGADVTEDYNGGMQWHTLLLARSLTLGTGTHTITIQIMSTTLSTSAANLTVYKPVLSLVGYNKVDGQPAASQVQSQTVAAPANGAPGQQDLTAGSWQTVANVTVPVTAASSGVYALSFQAQAQSNGANTVYLQYLIDGQPDSADVAQGQSASQADSATDFADGFGAGTWHTLSLLHLITLTPGTHTVSVQVWASQQATTAGSADLVVTTPQLALTSFNNINPTGGTTGGTGTGGGTTTNGPGFNYNAATGVLVINGTRANDTFKFAQSTQAVGGNLVTTYTFTLNGTTRTYTSSQLTQVTVNGNGGSNTANLTVSDNYVGNDGLAHQTVENMMFGPGGGILQETSATGIVSNFLQLTHFGRINAYMGYGDSAQFTDSAGNDIFDSAGLVCYMSGPGYYNYEAGAGSVTATSSNGGHDDAYLYDGSGASTFTATGTISSVMTGTDQGKTFTNTALGFMTNYGIARHKGDIANFYDSPSNDVFVGQATYSYMYSYTGSVETMSNIASGFSHVNAYSTAGGNDIAFNHAPSINTVTGFKKVYG